MLIMSILIIIVESPSPLGRGWGGAKAVGFWCFLQTKKYSIVYFLK
jgi:hypothetical protein